jgi:uncharacterized protein YdeI (BOF family)
VFVLCALLAGGVAAAAAPQSPAPIVGVSSIVAGQTVTIEGAVSRVLDSDLFWIADQSGAVRVLTSGPMGVQPGQRLRVTGLIADHAPFGVSRPEVIARHIEFVDGEPPRLTETPVVEADGPLTAVSSLRRGQRAVIRGEVQRVVDEDEFVLRDESGRVEVYIGPRLDMPVNEGEVVTVWGWMDDDLADRDFYARTIRRADGSTINLRGSGKVGPVSPAMAEPPAATSQPAGPGTSAGSPAVTDRATITPIASVRRGQSVTVRGEVIRLTDSDEFRLRDETGALIVYIGWTNDMPVNVGQIVTVSGRMDDDIVPGRRPELYARSITLPDGKVITLRREGDR